MEKNLKKNRVLLLIPILTLLILYSCGNQDPKETSSSIVNTDDEDTTYLVAEGDIVVVSYTNDTLVVFDSNGNLKRTLYTHTLATDNITGLAWMDSTKELLISVDGTPDRIDAISVETGVVRNFYLNTTYLTGTIVGVGVLGTDVIGSESTTNERFLANGTRITSTIWPSNQPVNAQQFVELSTGNLLSCSSTAGLRIIPDSMTDITAVATLANQGGITASWGCAELSDGSIVATWSGASDYLYKYDASLGTATVLINNVQSTIQDPRGIAVTPDDKIYLSDATRNRVIKIDDEGNTITEFGFNVLQSPRQIVRIPVLD